ncbi:Stealth protein CR1, conserved region 1 [Loktanella atrilutea]|uniref:Stealth protein CR1, conserved region 1 n=1 Tax=Loktanella atrilutea TaxID=366533 RepID=A0A1M5FC83_LOKAT|nr:stealth family protein [Loktanella atrilutea]SHF89144.1 Stealth protein CR1, conserved region 1 [Loktanella atrilutea]
MIDAVITWVDGSDPVHLSKRERFQDPSAHPDASGQLRFASSGEIRFSVLSLLKFCPFVRCIHIVTDEQRPFELGSLPDSGKINYVDHKDIYSDHADLLPVFSSRSIEAMIHRIPDLAERFIYLNDDIFIGRPMQPTDFFNDDLPVLHGNLKKMPNAILQRLKSKLGRSRPGYKTAQQAAARTVGRHKDYLLVEHQPQPMRRSTVANYYNDKPAALRAQAKHRFRSNAQFSPIGLAHHLEIAAGARIFPPVDIGYIKPGHPTGSALARTMEDLNSDAYSSFCVQSLEAMMPDERATIISGLERRYG